MDKESIELIEYPLGITKRFFDTPPELRKQLIDELSGPIVMTNIIDNGECNNNNNNNNNNNIFVKTNINKEYDFFYSSSSFHAKLFDKDSSDENLCSKNITFHGFYNNKPIQINYNIFTYINHYDVSTDKIIKMIKTYHENGWLNNTLFTKLIVKIFSYENHLFKRDNSLYIYMLDLIKEYEKIEEINKKEVINNINEAIIDKKIVVDSIIILFNYCLNNEIDISKYTALYIKKNPSKLFYKYCIDKNLNIISDMEGLTNLIKILDYDECIHVINMYKMNNAFYVTKDFINVMLILHHNYVLENENPEFKQFIDSRTLEDVLIYGDASTIIALLDNGYKFEETICSIYIPSDSYINDLSHICNHVNVTTNFISELRFGVSLDKLHTINPNTNYDTFYIDRYYFNININNLDVFTGISKVVKNGIDDYIYKKYNGNFSNIPRKINLYSSFYYK